ncbi:MAG: hypothetical protein ACUVSU_10725 [Aggregatilineaceae bacterium]
MNRVCRIGVAVLSLLVLVSCGKRAQPSLPPGRSVPLPPISANITIVAGCDVEVLENWYEVTTSLVQTFQVESLAALDMAPEQQDTALAHLADLHRKLVAQPVPECAAVVHSTAVVHVEEIEHAFQRYADGDLAAQALRDQVTARVQSLRTDTAALMDSAATLLSQLLEERRATLTAGNAP